MFAFRCVPSPLHPHIAVFSARLPTNQVYQSLKLMNGPLVYNNERVVEERPILSAFASAALDFFLGGGGVAFLTASSLHSLGRKVLSLLFPNLSLLSNMRTCSIPTSGCVSPPPSSPLL